MAKKPDLLARMAGSFQQTASLLSLAVAERGGNLAEAVTLLAKPAHKKQMEDIAVILAGMKVSEETEAKAITDPRLEAWVKHYRKHFPRQLDAAGGEQTLRALQLSPAPFLSGARLMVVLKGIKTSEAFAACKGTFPSELYGYSDLDKDVPVNDRVPTETYAYWIRDRQEADEEFANQSANDIASKKIATMTLHERILLELFYFEETGNHLDANNVTLCSGSRDADGFVPRAGWHGGEFGVDGSYASYRDPRLRSREVFR